MRHRKQPLPDRVALVQPLPAQQAFALFLSLVLLLPPPSSLRPTVLALVEPSRARRRHCFRQHLCHWSSAQRRRQPAAFALRSTLTAAELLAAPLADCSAPVGTRLVPVARRLDNRDHPA